MNKRIDRRCLLRGAGVTMALPWLSAMQPACAAPLTSERPRRFVAMTLGLGLLAENLNPSNAGTAYQPSRYLKSVQDLRDRFTIISGTSHPGVTGGHRAEASLLTANPAAGSGRARNTISLDQRMAMHLGDQTRFPSLVLASSGSNSPSYTDSGAMIPAEESPSRLFAKMFINESATEKAAHEERVRHGRTIMDLVNDDAKSLSRTLGPGDRDRLDAYLSSVRDLEKRMAESEKWARLPKPSVDAPKPVDIRNGADFIGQQKLMNDMIILALQTDSTRFVTYHLGGSGGVVPLPGVDQGYHGLSHHGLDEDKMSQLAIVEQEIINTWAQFLRELAAIQEPDGSLLEQTSVLLTSNLGNASNHSNQNMPVLLAGGRFRHGQHLAFDTKSNYPLPNLYVNLLQQVGLETDSFASSTSTMTGV
jgi:hypothetical protein